MKTANSSWHWVFIGKKLEQEYSIFQTLSISFLIHKYNSLYWKRNSNNLLAFTTGLIKACSLSIISACWNKGLKSINVGMTQETITQETRDFSSCEKNMRMSQSSKPRIHEGDMVSTLRKATSNPLRNE